MLIVVIPSKSSVRTALKIKKLADEVGIKKISFVGNRVFDSDDEIFLATALGEEPIAYFPDSPAILKTERRGQPITDAIKEVQSAVSTLINKIIT